MNEAPPSVANVGHAGPGADAGVKPDLNLTTPPPIRGLFHGRIKSSHPELPDKRTAGPSARPLQPILVRRENFIKRRPGAREILRHRGPGPQRATQQPCLQLGALLQSQQVMDRVELYGIGPGQPIRPPAAAVLPPATTRGHCHSQAVKLPQSPPKCKPPAVAGPDLLPVKGLVSSNRPRLNRHGARYHGDQGRCDCIPAGGWWALRGGIWRVWCGPGGSGPAGAAGAFGVRQSVNPWPIVAHFCKLQLKLAVSLFGIFQ